MPVRHISQINSKSMSLKRGKTSLFSMELLSTAPQLKVSVAVQVSLIDHPATKHNHGKGLSEVADPIPLILFLFHTTIISHSSLILSPNGIFTAHFKQPSNHGKHQHFTAPAPRGSTRPRRVIAQDGAVMVFVVSQKN
jgi:hypothetical protein